MKKVLYLVIFTCFIWSIPNNCIGESIKKLFNRIRVNIGLNVSEQKVPMISHKVHVGCSVEIGNRQTVIAELCDRLKIRAERIGRDVYRSAAHLCMLWGRLQDYMQENTADSVIIGSALISVALLSAYLIYRMNHESQPQKVYEYWYEQQGPIAFDYEYSSHA